MAGAELIEGTGPSDGPSWSDIAHWYDELLTAGSGPHRLAAATIIDLVPPGRSGRVLDLACGQGFASRALITAGFTDVTGTDFSAAMIDNAIANGTPAVTDGSSARLRYVVDDGQRLDRFEDHSFDGVSCQLGLMDIPDLPATLAAVHRVLRPGGWFVFVISHPCFLAPHARPVEIPATAGQTGPVQAVAVHTYLTERFWRSSNPQGVRRAGNHHRTMATYVNELIAAGFTIERVVEPSGRDLLDNHSSVYGDVPMFLAARVRRS